MTLAPLVRALDRGTNDPVTGGRETDDRRQTFSDKHSWRKYEAMPFLFRITSFLCSGNILQRVIRGIYKTTKKSVRPVLCTTRMQPLGPAEMIPLFQLGRTRSVQRASAQLTALQRLPDLLSDLCFSLVFFVPRFPGAAIPNLVFDLEISGSGQKKGAALRPARHSHHSSRSERKCERKNVC